MENITNILKGVEALIEYFSEPATRRRFMTKCAQSNVEVVQLLHSAQLNEELDLDMLNRVLNISEYTTQLAELIDCMSSYFITHTSNSMHELIIKVNNTRIGKKYFLTSGLANNPHLSSSHINVLLDEVLNDKTISIVPEHARNIAYNKNTNSMQLNRLFQVNDLTTRKLIAKHKNVSTDTLILFLNHNSLPVRRLVSNAENATPEMKLFLIESTDEKSIINIAKHSNVEDIVVTHLLIFTQIRPTKKRLQIYLKNNPEFYNLGNMDGILSNKAMEAIRTPCISREELLRIHNEKYKLLMPSFLKSLKNTDEVKTNNIDILVRRYKLDNNDYNELVKSESCPREILKELFLQGANIYVNPKIQKEEIKLKGFIPNNSKEKIELARHSKSRRMHEALIDKECSSSKPNIDVMEALASNVHLGEKTINTLWHYFKVSNITLNRNCPDWIRKEAMSN